jgi:hypothetical protein
MAPHPLAPIAEATFLTWFSNFRDDAEPAAPVWQTDRFRTGK